MLCRENVAAVDCKASHFRLLDESNPEGVRKLLVGGIQAEDADLVQQLMERVESQDTILAAVTKLPVEAVIPLLKVIHLGLQTGQ